MAMAPPPPPKNRVVSAHVSASGGADRAIANCLALGPSARSAAFFVRPRVSWKAVAPLTSAKVAQFRQALSSQASDDAADRQQRPHRQIRLEHVVVHGSYLINLGTHDAKLRAKSVALMIEEVSKCAQLGVQLYVFHPGSCTRVARAGVKRARSEASSKISKPPRAKKRKASAKDQGREEHGDGERVEGAAEAELRRQSLRFAAESVATVLDSTTSTTLAVETMSSQGNVLGSSFQELRTIVTDVARLSTADDARARHGVCLDMCHVFASGWELDTEEKCEAMMQAFYDSMGPEWHDALKVVHVNGSHGASGSRTDRHANIGRGKIRVAAFRWLMNAPHFEIFPLILETPRAKSKAKEMEAKAKASSGSNGVVATKMSLATKSGDDVLEFDEPSARDKVKLLYSLVADECER